MAGIGVRGVLVLALSVRMALGVGVSSPSDCATAVARFRTVIGPGAFRIKPMSVRLNSPVRNRGSLARRTTGLIVAGLDLDQIVTGLRPRRRSRPEGAEPAPLVAPGRAGPPTPMDSACSNGADRSRTSAKRRPSANSRRSPRSA
jgi:hypothetical protein